MTNFCPHCHQAVPDKFGLVIDEDRHEVRFNGLAVLNLTGSEFAVLQILYDRIGRVVRKESIMDQVYGLGADEEPDIKIVDVFVCKIRPKLKPLGIQIKTHWGVGFELLPPAKDGEVAA